MLHWARSYALIALTAGVFALGGLAPVFTAAAFLLAIVFAALTALSFATLALGRRRDGTYSQERALLLLGIAVAAVLLAGAWVDWEMGDAERMLLSSLR